MWAYLVNSLVWSGVGLLGGAALTEAGYDLLTMLRKISGRRNRDDT